MRLFSWALCSTLLLAAPAAAQEVISQDLPSEPPRPARARPRPAPPAASPATPVAPAPPQALPEVPAGPVEAPRRKGPSIGKGLDQLCANQEAARPPPSNWRRGLGIGGTLGGLALLGAGVAVAVANGQSAATLEQRYQTRSLTPADRSGYSTVRQLNAVGVSLLGVGAVAAVGGVVLWVTAPNSTLGPRGACVGVAGEF